MKPPRAHQRLRSLLLVTLLAGAAPWIDACSPSEIAPSEPPPSVASEEAGAPARVDGGATPAPSSPDTGSTALDGADAAHEASTIDAFVEDADAGTSQDASPDATALPDPGGPWHLTLGQTFYVNDVLTTPAGATYLVGARLVGGVMRGLVAKITPEGKLDTTFGTAGYAEVLLSATKAHQPLRGVLLPNGSLVLVGVVYSTPWDFVLTRLDASGGIDPTYGVGGIRQAHVGVGNDLPFGITLGPNGTVLFTGLAFGVSNTASEIVAGRVTANGALDPTFDGDGFAMTSIGARNIGKAIGLLSQDRILVAAHSDNAGDIVLVRFTSGGALDPSFTGAVNKGPGTRVIRFDAATYSSPEGMVKDGSGKWVVFGKGEVPAVDAGPDATRSAFLAVRVDEDGVIDPGFHAGPFALPTTGSTHAYSFAAQPNGPALLAGSVYEGPSIPFDASKYWPAIVALDTGGNVDPNALGAHQGIYVPKAYEGSSATVAPLPNGHFVAVASTAASVEVFEIVP